MKNNITKEPEVKKDIAYKIVEFWHVIEFLSQEAYPKDTKDNKKKLELVTREQQDKFTKEDSIRKISKFNLFRNFPLECEINALIEQDNDFFSKHPICSSAMHLCIGRIKREILISSLYKILNLIDDRPEEDFSDICLIGLKVDKDGIYIENSFRVSPLVWGIYKCFESGGSIDGIISSKNYNSDMKEFEERISKEEPLKNETIIELYNLVCVRFIKPFCEGFLKSVVEGSFIYTRYDNEKTFNREDDKAEDISELVKGFYADDLEMVKEALNSTDNSTDNSNGMYSDLVDYIIGAYCEDSDNRKIVGIDNRIDIRNDEAQIEKWICPDKAPSGKWPSRFNPALMQQIAINIGINEKNQIRKIFSVNGPPGTGKTTLLKEIIVSNIVKRAEFICKYENADDAFEARYFEHGTFANKGYDKYCNKYYCFKDDELSHFSILVASCNNAAVENISKELPDGKALLSGLKSDKKDKEDTIKGLEDISSLFDLTKNTKKELYKEFIENENGKIERTLIERGDIYFSWLAHKLMSQNDEEEDSKDTNEWGLISAPMGKASNIAKYCYFVLNEVIESFFAGRNEKINSRHENFLEVKEKFSNQLAKVESMKVELFNASQISKVSCKKENNNKKLIQKSLDEINRLEDEVKRYLNIIQKLEIDKSEINKLISIIKDKENKYIEILKINENNILELSNEIGEIQDKIINKEDSRKWYEILLGRWIHTERLRQIFDLKEKKKAVDIAKTDAEAQKENNVNKYNEFLQEKNEIEKQYLTISNSIEDHKMSIRKLHSCVEEEKKSIEMVEKIITDDRKKLEDTLNEYSKSMVVINDKFWSDFKSNDEDVSTRIQTSNPWVTEVYNREREKLFYLALQLHKEFVLSSKACRDNFINLTMLWKYRSNSQNEICLFSQEDKNKSYIHLINTLFLLTPVMSTTFASVGRFLGNIKEHSRLGLLIIDEAGQAAPHVALGALWRCKKAIVVGDPKQVEPVVTDDADAIKKAFSHEILMPYLNKTISVQGFADRINVFGSFIKDSTNKDAPSTWVGCPLLVHRRCINPMFDISNELSYGGTMKILTAQAKKEDEEKFVLNKSCWIDISGKENGNKNHFVNEQGIKALEIIISSFRKNNGLPDLFVISPFTTVINEIKEMVNQTVELNEYKEEIETWVDEYCGTVHKFQGKEAKEVIFLLGCDESASGAVRWVKSNIINVAATRAKYRLYIIGSYNVWKKSKIFEITKNIIDYCK